MTVFDEARSISIRGTRREKMGPLARKQAWWGILFISPWLIGFLLFTLIPMLASFLMSFTNFNITQPGAWEFIGLRNYQRLFTDGDLRAALSATFKFFAIALPIAIIQPILMAQVIIAKPLQFKRGFTTLFYMTYMVPLVSAILIWRGMLNPQSGWINRALGVIGVRGPDWLNSTTWVYPALILS